MLGCMPAVWSKKSAHATTPSPSSHLIQNRPCKLDLTMTQKIRIGIRGYIYPTIILYEGNEKLLLLAIPASNGPRGAVHTVRVGMVEGRLPGRVVRISPHLLPTNPKP